MWPFVIGLISGMIVGGVIMVVGLFMGAALHERGQDRANGG